MRKYVNYQNVTDLCKCQHIVEWAGQVELLDAFSRNGCCFKNIVGLLNAQNMLTVHFLCCLYNILLDISTSHNFVIKIYQRASVFSRNIVLEMKKSEDIDLLQETCNLLF